MKMHAIDELRAFHAFLGGELSNGGADLSPEEAVDEWHDLHPDPEFLDEEAEAIQEALDDIANGDPGHPADEVIAELRARYCLPTE
jgi:hypothetical protein